MLPHEEFSSVPSSVPAEARQPHALDKFKAPDKSWIRQTMHKYFLATKFLGAGRMLGRPYWNPRKKEKPVTLILFLLKIVIYCSSWITWIRFNFFYILR